MKKTRRIAAFIAAMAMAACVAVPFGSAMTASAAELTISGTTNVDATKHLFKAYQIFTGTVETVEGANTLTGVAWSTSLNNTAQTAFINAIKANTAFGTGSYSHINALTGSSTAGEVAAALGDITTDTDCEKLAKIIAKFVKDNSITATATAEENKFTDLANGYYFINDETPAEDEAAPSTQKGYKDNAVSKYILWLTGSTTIKIKTDAPTLDKKILHNESAATGAEGDHSKTGWGVVGDNQIGDTVYYYIETSVPDMSKFDDYDYIIHDTMTAGLTMGSVTKIVYVPGKYSTTADGTAAANSENVEFVLYNGSAVEGLTVSAANAVAEGTDDMTITFADLKTFVSAITDATDSTKKAYKAEGGTIYTYYTATLNANALVAQSADDDNQHNDNTAYLEYSNNPNQSGDGTSGNENEHGKTPKKTVYDWTFTTQVNKINQNSVGVVGAKFKLYDAETDGNEIKLSAITKPSSWPTKTVDSEDVDKTFAELTDDDKTALADDAYYKLYARLGAAPEADVLYYQVDANGGAEIETTDGKTKFEILGLDDGKDYYLEETAKPTGYTQLTARIKMNITDEYVTAGNELKSLSVAATSTETGVLADATKTDTKFDVINLQGSTLPETGGMGTVLFYTVGGVLVIGAGVVLVTKKRMGKED